MSDAVAARLVVHADRRLAERVRDLAGQRMVFFAGLPGTGKSLLVHQLVHLAGAGETPFVGHRFIDLARRLDDDAEALLTASSCRFVIAVPSREVRRFLEARRERRAVHPRHPREREDAPPHVLRDLWANLAEISRGLELSASAAVTTGSGSPPVRVVGGETVPYDPVVYARVYERVLRHRNAECLALDVILPTEQLSVYDFAVALHDLTPTEAEAETFIREIERRYADPAALEGEVARWWET